MYPDDTPGNCCIACHQTCVTNHGCMITGNAHLRVNLAVAVDGNICAIFRAAQLQEALRVRLLQHARVRFLCAEVPDHDLDPAC